jgi:hypothetical protein
LFAKKFKKWLKMAKNVVFGRGLALLHCVFLGKLGEKTKTAVTKIYKKYKYTEKNLRVINYKIVLKVEYLNRVSP